MNWALNCFRTHHIHRIWLPSDYYLFADLKKMLQGKRFYSNEEVFTETNAYFEAKDKSFYKKGIEMLEKRWTDCVAFEGDYADE